MAVRRAFAAVLVRPGDADEAGLVHLLAPFEPGLGRQVPLEPAPDSCAEGGLLGTVAQVHLLNLNQDHGSDHVSGLEIRKSTVDLVQTDRLRDHSFEVEFSLARPGDQLREVLRGPVIASV